MRLVGKVRGEGVEFHISYKSKGGKGGWKCAETIEAVERGAKFRIHEPGELVRAKRRRNRVIEYRHDHRGLLVKKGVPVIREVRIEEKPVEQIETVV